MKTKQPKSSDFDVKKWGFFFIFLVSLVLVLFFVLNSEGEEDATNALTRARLLNGKARTEARMTNSPSDLSNADLSTDFLEKAETLFIESEYQAATEQARQSIIHAEKILKRQNAVVNSAIKFSEIVGEVLVRKEGNANYTRANMRMELNLGDEIKTLTSGSCRMSYQDGMTTVLWPSSLLTLQKDVDDLSKLSLFLEDGQLEVKTSELQNDRKMGFISSAGRASLYPNAQVHFKLDANARALDVTVRFGRADVRAGTDTAIVGPNQRLRVTDGTLSTAQDLPAVPVSISPVHSSKFETNANGFASVALRWEAVNGASGYHVQLARDPFFVSLVQEKNNYRTTRLEYRNLEQGNYYWRVSALNRSGVEGLLSLPLPFQVISETRDRNDVADAKPPKLKITSSSLQGYMAIITGTTDRDASVKLNGEAAVVDKENGTWSSVLKLPGYGLHNVDIVAEGSSGGVAYEKLSFEVKDR